MSENTSERPVDPSAAAAAGAADFDGSAQPISDDDNAPTDGVLSETTEEAPGEEYIEYIEEVVEEVIEVVEESAEQAAAPAAAAPAPAEPAVVAAAAAPAAPAAAPAAPPVPAAPPPPANPEAEIHAAAAAVAAMSGALVSVEEAFAASRPETPMGRPESPLRPATRTAPRKKKVNNDLKKAAIPVLFTVGALLFVPGFWAIGVLTGRIESEPGSEDANAKMAWLMASACFPIASLLFSAAIFYIVKIREDKN